MARHSAFNVWPGNRFAQNIVGYVTNVLPEVTTIVLGSGIVVRG